MEEDVEEGIEREEIQLTKNPGIYSILDEDQIVTISGRIRVHGKVYEISVFLKNYCEENNIKTIEVELNIEDELSVFDEDFYDIKIKLYR